MESDFSAMSSMSEQLNIEDSVPGLYKETNRLALYALLQGGQKAYQDFLKAEGLTDFLSEEEISYIVENKKWPSEDDEEDLYDGMENAPSTYCPMESDVEVPDLDLGWPEARLDHLETNVRMFFHPPRQNMPNIKTLVRKYIREAKMVIAIAMDIFTDVDIFRDLVEVSTRGVVVYILLDDQQFSSFFRMSEKASVPLQKLWNIRIRTVKGHEYRCQSGARFHGAMEQKFMLVDCHTVLYGSYSFMWSYEKINLSMVLLITGKLVACYDEEFRRLFARSIIPALLIQQPISTTDHSNTSYQAPQFGLRSTQLFERSNSFDPTLLKSMRGGRVNVLNHGDKPEEGLYANGAAIRRGLNLQRNLAADLAKQTNSYGALQNRMYSSLRQRSRVVTGKGTEAQDRDLFSSLGHLNHQSQTWQPAQENSSLPGPQSFLSASEMSLHKWRIESYLKNDHIPADSTDSLDCISVRSDSKSSLLSSQSSRPNLIFKAPEQPGEPRSMQSPFLGRRTVTSVYSCLQKAKDNSSNKDPKIPEISAERKISEEPITHSSTQPNPPEPVKPSTAINYPPVRTTGQLLPETNHEPDPGVDAVISNPTSPTPSLPFSPQSSIIGENEKMADSLKDEKPSPLKLTETQRSISHYDIKTIDDKNTQTYGWQEPPSRTASAMHLGKVVDNSLMKGSNLKRLRPFSDSNKTRLSLIEIPEEKDGLGSRRNLDELSSSKDSSVQNLTTLTKAQQAPIEAHVHISDRGLGMAGMITSPTASYSSVGRAPHVATPVLTRAMNNTWGSPRKAEEERHAAAAAAASPRTMSALDMAANAHRRVDHGSVTSVATVESVMSNPDEGRYGLPDIKRNKAYSRFEHFLSVERRNPDKIETERMNAYAAEKRRTLFMGSPTSYTRYQTQTHSDNNRFGKFIQRVGSFITKNK